MNVIIYLRDEKKIAADGGIPYDPEQRKPSPATVELMKKLGEGGGAGDGGRRITEGGRPVSPERSRV